MRIRLSAGTARARLAAALATPAAAANKEHQQLMADIRMLQEQSQQLQNLLGQLGEALKAVNTRLDDQANANRKAFADQKLIIDTLSSDLRVVREKVDDNNVRIGSLTQEARRRCARRVQQLSTAALVRPDAAGTSGDAPAGGPRPPPPRNGSRRPCRARHVAAARVGHGVLRLHRRPIRSGGARLRGVHQGLPEVRHGRTTRRC